MKLKCLTIFVFSLMVSVVLLAGCKSKPKAPPIDVDMAKGEADTSGTLSSDNAGDEGQQPDDVRPLQQSDLDAGYGSNAENMLRPIFFDYDRSDIRPDQILVLERNADWLDAHSNAAVVIEGHCDERGTEEYNLALGARRAEMTRNYLIGLGVEERRLRALSFGENRPFANQHDEDAWQENRRAHFAVRENQ